MIINQIKQLASQNFDLWQSIRRHLHKHPELSFEEYKTHDYIVSLLEKWQIPHQKNICGTGIIALLESNNPTEKCIAIRAELDALPILETNTIDYHSINKGIMHACGHDVHTTCMLGAIYVLAQLKDAWSGSIKFIFQPGEEKHPGGGSLMVAAKVLENPKVNALFALHVYPHLTSGTVGFRGGTYMASTDEIFITINGKGGHAALPHLTIDPITIAAHLLTGLQQLISRKSNPVVPAVLSFGKISGGTVNNVIPDQVTLEGTLRTMNEDFRTSAHEWISNFVNETCKSFGATATIEIPKGYPSLYNNPELTAQSFSLAESFLGANQVKTLDLRMTADDFAFYAQEIPGCYFRLGTNSPDNSFSSSVHTSNFDIDESALLTGIGLMSYLVTQIKI